MAVFEKKWNFKSSSCRFSLDLAVTNVAFQNDVKRKRKMIAYSKLVWTLPEQGSYRLNVDAAWIAPGKASAGCVITKDDSSWEMGLSVKLSGFTIRTPAEVELELIVLRDGLHLAKELNIQQLEVETDAEGVKDPLDINNEFGVAIADVSSLFNSSWKVSLPLWET